MCFFSKKKKRLQSTAEQEEILHIPLFERWLPENALHTWFVLCNHPPPPSACVYVFLSGLFNRQFKYTMHISSGSSQKEQRSSLCSVCYGIARACAYFPTIQQKKRRFSTLSPSLWAFITLYAELSLGVGFSKARKYEPRNEMQEWNNGYNVLVERLIGYANDTQLSPANGYNCAKMNRPRFYDIYFSYATN